MTQADRNPFKYSNTNKRYYTYDYYLKTAFLQKCAKITLDAGFTCPNIDGTVGVGGCIYCQGGSASINCRETTSIEEQYKIGVENARRKWDVKSFIPYLQAYTNTHGDINRLREIYEKAASLDGAVMLAIATRADCLSPAVVRLIDEVSRKIPVTVELGLQTSNDETARKINRCHDYEAFKEGFCRLREMAPEVKIGVHIINGLPYEGYFDMIKTARDVALLHPDLVKIHLLHVIEKTPLAKMYLSGEYTPISREDYIKTVCDQLELLPPDTVIERVTGDGISDSLLAPSWSIKKTTVINDIDKELYRRGSYQGIKYQKEN